MTTPTTTSTAATSVFHPEWGLTLKEFIAAVRRYWRTFAVVAAAVFLLGLTSILLMPAKYTSTAQLLVSISGSTTAAAYQNDEVVAGRVNSYIALLSSDVVSQRVIDRLGLSMTAPELATQISATNVPPKTSIIDVAVTADSPDRAKTLANTVASEFISYATALETPTGEDGQRVHVTTVNTASHPRHAVVERLVLGILAAVAAALAGAVAVWIRSGTDPVVRSPDRGAAAAGVPVLGSVTAGAVASESELEAYRRLRTALRSAVATQEWNVFEIVPADRSLDAADIASNLSRALQLEGRTCVVLDAVRVDSSTESDEEHESHEEHGSAADADSVSGNRDNGNDSESAPVEARPVLPSPKTGRRASVDTISLTTAGAEPGLIEPHAAAEQIDQLRAEYDQVLVAAPAARDNLTASVLSDYVDAVLLIASTATTTRGDLHRTAQALKDAGADVLGLILVRDDRPGTVDGQIDLNDGRAHQPETDGHSVQRNP